MKSTLILLLSFLISLSTLAQEKKTVPAQVISSIDSVLNQVLKDQYIAGFAVAIVKGNEVIYSKGFGYRDLENKKPVTPNTLFAIGSSTKAFTAGLLGLLKKEGKLTFEDKAVNLLPQLRFYNDEMNNQITVRDLMAHRTGLSRYDYSWLLFNTSNRDSIIARVKYMQPTAAVRQKWYYNNFMYLAQGMIAEKLSGKTWEQNIKEKFFEPLGMTRSNTEMKTFQADSNASLPYATKGEEIKKVDYYNINGMGPAGSINSSVSDMANWLKVWINGGTFQKKEILPANYIAEAVSSQMVMDGGLPSAKKDIYFGNYGLGWMLSSYRGHYMVEHGGNISGFSGNVAFYPTDQIGIVVLTNQNQSEVPDVVRNSIADRLLGLKAIDWNGEVKAAAKEEASAKKEPKKAPILQTKPSHQLKDYEGMYENPAYGAFKVWLEKERLYTILGDEKVVFQHKHYDVFDPRSIDKKGVADTTESNLLFNFRSGQDGQIQNVVVPMDGQEVVFTYRPIEKVLTAKQLEKYVGEYSLGTTPIKVSLKGNTLFVLVPGQPEYETAVVDEQTFSLKALKGYSVKFELDAKQKVTALLFMQPNGVFKAVKKG